MDKYTRFEIMDEAEKYEADEFELFFAEYGWQDWMNDYTEAEDDDPVPDENLKYIDMILKDIFDEVHEMKYWKVYAKCCTVCKHIQEIDKREAYDLITDNVIYNDSYEWLNDIDSDVDTAFNIAYTALLEKAEDFFEENGFYECGDFKVVYDWREPKIPNVCGNSNSMLN